MYYPQTFSIKVWNAATRNYKALIPVNRYFRTELGYGQVQEVIKILMHHLQYLLKAD